MNKHTSIAHHSMYIYIYVCMYVCVRIRAAFSFACVLTLLCVRIYGTIDDMLLFSHSFSACLYICIYYSFSSFEDVHCITFS